MVSCPSVKGIAPESIIVNPTAKRLYDVSFAGCGLILLSPLFLVIAALVKFADGGPIFYRQVRVGQGGRSFPIWKFRTMIPNADQTGPLVTSEGDARITGIGRMLRRTKLDELPQLWNVLRGDMSLVGPRPEVPRYVQQYTPEQREILRCKPGITDLASLCFREEEALLGNTVRLENFYLQHCIPRKLRLNWEYAARANLLTDTWIILRTLCPYWVGVLATYGVLLVISFWLSYELIYDFARPPMPRVKFLTELGVMVAFQLGCLTWRKQCTGLLSYFSFRELRQVGTALGVAALGLLGLRIAIDGTHSRNLILIDGILSFCLLGGFRMLLRRWRESSGEEESATVHPPARVGIIGAGCIGAQLAVQLLDKKNSGRTVVAFFDDDFNKWQKRIHEVPVVGMPECLLEGWTDKLDEVVIAMPGAPPDRMREIDQLLRKTRLKFYSISSPRHLWRSAQCEGARASHEV
jgi:lipopolysaccharide/colanic/teichoic acid biosynthesis glycosyltransferase